jgi:hypothetical protein
MNFHEYVALVEDVEKRDETAAGKSRGELTVECRPVLEDQQIVQRQSRVSCLTKPYQACPYCPHSSFDLLFNVSKEQRLEQVSCPRWASGAGRISGNPPDAYVSVEVATCTEGPFEFCPSCPSRKNVQTAGADKSVPGWYGRWKRLRCVEDEDG